MHLIKHRPTASGNEIPLLPRVRHENRFTWNGKKSAAYKEALKIATRKDNKS